MSETTLALSFSRIHNTLASNIEHTVCLYTSTGVGHIAHPSPIYGYPTINDLSTFLPDHNSKFAIQIANTYTRQAIDSAPWYQSEVDLDSGLLSVRLVNDARDLIRSSSYEPMLLRTDGSLVIWGDDEEATMCFWADIMCRLQKQPGTTSLGGGTTPPVAGLPELTTNQENFTPWPLPLDDFAYLFTFAEFLPPPGADPQGYYEASAHPSWQQQQVTSGSSDGGLAFVLSQRPLSPSLSDTTTTSSFLDSPFAGDLDNVFSNFDALVHIGEEDHTINTPLDLLFANGEGGESPPVVETEIPPFAKGIDQNATEKDEEAGHHIPASNTRARVLKRRPSVFVNDSSLALPTTPVPDVEYAQSDNNRRRKFLAIAPASAPTSASVSTPIPTPVPVPAPAAPTSTAASARPPRRPGNRRRGSCTTGRARRKERFPCRYCKKKTFSRSQDLERHLKTSCDSNDNRATVVCPECHSVLSRMDAAQRHWRAHQNPSCPPPDWVSTRNRSFAGLRL